MLEIVIFTNGRYGLKNTVTGKILTDPKGKTLNWAKPRGAVRHMEHLNRKLARTLRSLDSIKE
jgi:hypothetical protein